MRSAADKFVELEERYINPLSGRVATPHEGVTHLDFQLRFLSLLAASTLRTIEVAGPRIGRAPGLGEWLTFLRGARQEFDGRPEAACSALRNTISQVLEYIGQGVSSAPAEIRSIKKLRDYLFHGGRLPVGSDLHVDINALVENVSNAIRDCLANAVLKSRQADVGVSRPCFVWEEDAIELWPYMYEEDNGAWCIFSRAASMPPAFLCFDPSDEQRLITHPSDEEILSALQAQLQKRLLDRSLERFITDVSRDLEAFTEDGFEPVYFEADVGFGYRWEKATGEGVEYRTDLFRLGPDDAKQWHDGSEWTSYKAFLRTLANWKILARRLRLDLDIIEKKLDHEERESLGWTSGLPVQIRDARVAISDMDGNDPEHRRFSELMSGVDEDLQTNRGETQVVFITGEAGIGKTRAMVRSARKRALEVEQRSDGDNDLPLLLYVRSTGHVLDNLTTVVKAAVASTLNLTEKRVKVLCRNGLMILLIDGFDELLGGVGYSDAIGSLRPWINDLGGRGVLVLSARSSYFRNLYRSSVERASEEGPLQVRHRVVEIERWRREEIDEFLQDAGVAPQNVERLNPGDQELLGLPFFARVFAEMCLTEEWAELPDDFSLRDLLLEKYVAREEQKILSGGDEGSALLDQQELMRTFEHVAEFMAGNAEREVDVDDLEIAVAAAIEDDLDMRPGLKRRLLALCGLAVADGRGAAARFRFQHELFFDHFLAGMAARYLQDGNQRAFLGMLNNTPWRPATVAGLMAKVGPDLVANALLGFRVDRSKAEIVETVATNLGALWAAVIRESGEVPSIHIYDAIFTDKLDLSEVRCDAAGFVGCTLSALVLPLTGGWSLTLEDTKIKKITVSQRPPDLSGLQGVMHKEIMELHVVADQWWDYRQSSIREKLQELNAGVSDAERQDNPEPEAVEAARYYLRKLSERIDTSVVMHESVLRPDDKRLKWVDDYGPSNWKIFVTSLKDCELASLDSFSASGSRKVRLRLKASPSAILEQGASGNPKIENFWAALAET